MLDSLPVSYHQLTRLMYPGLFRSSSRDTLPDKPASAGGSENDSFLTNLYECARRHRERTPQHAWDDPRRHCCAHIFGENPWHCEPLLRRLRLSFHQASACTCGPTAIPTCSEGTCGCTACPANQVYNSTTGSCSACASPTVFNNGKCSLCPNGSGYSSTSGSCVPCAVPQIQINGICSLCPAGSGYNSITSTCVACAAPQTQINGVCSLCPMGSGYSSLLGTCVPCTTLQVQIGGLCSVCPSGQGNVNGVCVACAAPLVSSQGICQTCPAGTSYSDGQCTPPPSGRARQKKLARAFDSPSPFQARQTTKHQILARALARKVKAQVKLKAAVDEDEQIW